MKLHKGVAGKMLNKLSRFIGNHDISNISDGTVTGAITDIHKSISEDCIIINGSTATIMLDANGKSPLKFPIPEIEGCKCILGIASTNSNGNVIPERPANVPAADGTIELYFSNISGARVTSEQSCILIYIKTNK